LVWGACYFRVKDSNTVLVVSGVSCKVSVCDFKHPVKWVWWRGGGLRWGSERFVVGGIGCNVSDHSIDKGHRGGPKVEACEGYLIKCIWAQVVVGVGVRLVAVCDGLSESCCDIGDCVRKRIVG
jgi:hypothetical protein